jgi:hypothetical protein
MSKSRANMNSYYRAFEVLGSKDPSATCAARLPRCETEEQTRQQITQEAALFV